MSETKEKSEKVEAKWHMSVQQMPHQKGFNIPVFEWSYGQTKGIRGGELQIWPLQPMIVFKDRRESEPDIFKESDMADKALAKVEEYGWGKPTCFDEVFKKMEVARENWPPEDVEEIKKVFGKLRAQWEALANSDA